MVFLIPRVLLVLCIVATVSGFSRSAFQIQFQRSVISGKLHTGSSRNSPSHTIAYLNPSPLYASEKVLLHS